MGSGKTEEMIQFSRQNRWRTIEFVPKDRDRSLRGKARIKARKAANKK